MIGADLDDEIVDEVDAIETNRVLVGALSKIPAIQWLANSEKLRNPTQSLNITPEEILSEDDEKVAEYVEIWEEANSNLPSSSNHQAHEAQLEDLPNKRDVNEYLDSFRSTPHFEQVVSNLSDDSWAMKLVPIESIVAIQPSITMGAYQDIPTSEDGYREVLEYCLPLRADQLLIDQAIQTPDNSLLGYQLVSRGPNIRVANMELDRDSFDESGAVSIRFDVKPNINFVQVVQYQNRLILKNGYHRTFQLLKEGETHVPAFVRTAQHYKETGGQKPGFFDEEMVTSADPPMVSDFISDGAVDLDSPGTNKVIRVLAETTIMRR